MKARASNRRYRAAGALRPRLLPEQGIRLAKRTTPISGYGRNLSERKAAVNASGVTRFYGEPYRVTLTHSKWTLADPLRDEWKSSMFLRAGESGAGSTSAYQPDWLRAVGCQVGKREMEETFG